METIDIILAYCCGADPDKAALGTDRADMLWSKNAVFEREMCERFEISVQLAGQGNLDPWRAEPRGRLGLITLTDQSCRNIYRDSPRAFGFDAKALA